MILGIAVLAVFNIILIAGLIFYFNEKIDKIKTTSEREIQDLTITKEILRSVLIKDTIRYLFTDNLDMKIPVKIGNETKLVKNAIRDAAKSNIDYKEEALKIVDALRNKDKINGSVQKQT
jgi:hypothetical protein